MKKAKAKIKADAKNLAVKAIKSSRERKRAKKEKKAKKRFRAMVLFPAFRNIFLLCLGCLVGIHRHVIIDYVKTGQKPECPHKWLKPVEAAVGKLAKK